MGFSITKEFPGRFVRGDDIVGHEVNVTIRDVKKDLVFSPTKQKKEQALVVFFEKKDKGVLLSKTRAMDIKAITGSDDTDGWIGKTVCMFVVQKDAFGKMQNIIRFKKPIPDAVEQKKVLSKELDSIATAA